MFSSILKLSVLAALVVAQDPCNPGNPNPPTSTTTTPPTGPTAGVKIWPNNNTGKCVDVQGANFANGTPVQIYDCNGSKAQQWSLVFGNQQSLKVAGTNFCLDAGSNPTSGSKVKLWQCYPGLAQQQWYYTNDRRIAITNKGLCLDLTDGKSTNGNQLQVWECGTGNTNQVWNSDAKQSARRRRNYYS